jgi:PAS domain S-box-containing protein
MTDMLRQGISEQKMATGLTLSGSARKDLGIIAGMTALLIVLVIVSVVKEKVSVGGILPYVLLWIALSLAGFAYRRWQEEKAANEGVIRPYGALAPSGMGDWDWDIVSDTLVWTDEIYDIFGVIKEEYQPSYLGLLKLTHPEDRLHVEEAVSRSLRENSDYTIDHRIVTPAGDVRIVSIQGEVTFKDGHPVRMKGVVTDVTERKQTETELRDRFGLLQSLIDAIPIPVYHKDNKGVYEGCNKAFEDFVEATKEDILGKTIHDFLPPDIADPQDSMDKALFRQGGTQTYEKMILTKEGDAHNVIYHKAALSKADGSPGGLIGTILDISDRKRMEVALRESEQRFRNIAQSASDWFWETDKDHRFSFLSDRVKDSLGISSVKVLGKTRMEIVSREQQETDPEKWQQHFDTLNRHLPFRDFIYTFSIDGGDEHHIRINGVPVFNEDGDFKGYQGTGTDISGHMRVEEALRESEERHRDFAADVAHKLRTPLAVLRTHLDNLSDSKEVQSLRQDVDNMSRLVAQLLAATRIETFTPLDALNDVDLREVCRSVATLIAPLAIKEHRSIEVTGGKDAVLVKGNSGTLEQAVRNLVENAIRYSARGTVITLNVIDKDVPTIKVIDRGRGIALEHRDKIFARFKRSDRRGGGAGLGLSIVKRAVEGHNAKIDIEDTPEGGATFIIRFPVFAPALNTENQAQA